MDDLTGIAFSRLSSQSWIPAAKAVRAYLAEATAGSPADVSPGAGRDRCHLQVVSSGNGAASPAPTTVETHGPAHGGTRQRPGTGEHHDQELPSRCDEGLGCRP
jgi:hypothetical protein